MLQFVILIHHADALPGRSDKLRPLSDRGREQAQAVARAAAARGAKPGIIWHSGRLRARQTAEAWVTLVSPNASLIELPSLGPEDDPEIAAAMLAADQEAAAIAIASHMPFLPALLHRLTTGRRDRLTASFPMNGCVALARVDDRYEEKWRVSPDDRPT